MDDAIGRGSGEQYLPNTDLGAGSVGSVGCSFNGSYRGFEDGNTSRQLVSLRRIGQGSSSRIK